MSRPYFIFRFLWQKNLIGAAGGLIICTFREVYLWFYDSIPFEESLDGCGVCLRVADSSGVYICKSIVNYLRHGNFIYKSEVIYLRVAIEAARVSHFVPKHNLLNLHKSACPTRVYVGSNIRHGKQSIPWDSSGVYICKSIVNYLRHGKYICKL